MNFSLNGINQFNGSSSDQAEVSQSGGKSVFQNVTFSLSINFIGYDVACLALKEGGVRKVRKPQNRPKNNKKPQYRIEI